MPRVAIKVAYDGTRFSGSQRQPGARTVEGDLLEALLKVGAIGDAESARFLASSRTDAGVSAAGNVFALDTSFRLPELPGAINAHARDFWVHAYAPVPDDFHPRFARRRRYVYFQKRDGFDEASFAATLAIFEGEHDFTSFARLEPGVNPVRRIDRIAVAPHERFLVCRFAGGSFLWNQIRRMIAASLEVARGAATRDEVRAALDRTATRDFGVAPAEPLVLLDVEYAFPLESAGAAAARVAKVLEERLLAADLVRERERLLHSVVTGSA